MAIVPSQKITEKNAFIFCICEIILSISQIYMSRFGLSFLTEDALRLCCGRSPSSDVQVKDAAHWSTKYEMS